MSVFNGERYLMSAIESCLNQTHANIELIVIDDGSVDRSKDIVRSFKDNRIRLLVNETNKGQSYSRNRGIRESTGEYIAIMDADDVAYPNRIEEQVKYLQENSAIGICGSWVDIIDEQGRFERQRKVPTDNTKIKANLIFDCPMIHPTVMFKKKLFREFSLYYNSEFTYAQDMELWSRAMFHVDFGNIPNSLIKMRFANPYSISFSKKDEQMAFGMKVIQNTFSKLGLKYGDMSELNFLQRIIFFHSIVQSMHFLVPKIQMAETLLEHLKLNYQKVIYKFIIKVVYK